MYPCEKRKYETVQKEYPLLDHLCAHCVGFAEAGNNWNNWAAFDPFTLFRSAGFGARIFMPAFGLIGLNWAYGFDRVPGRADVSGSQFHFTIGQQLR